MDKPDSDITCPATMHSDKCSDHFMNCPKWVNVQGTHPQSGEIINRYNCADVWMPILLVENSMRQMGTQESVESFRNEMVKDNLKMLSMSHKLIVGD